MGSTPENQENILRFPGVFRSGWPDEIQVLGSAIGMILALPVKTPPSGDVS